MRIRRRYIFLCLLLSAALGINAQELLVKVNVNHSQIEGSEVSVFTNLQQSLEQFLNDRQWTSLQFLHIQYHRQQICSRGTSL